MLGAAPDRLRRVFPATRAPLAGMTTLEVVLGRRPGFEETRQALAEGFRREHRLALVPGGLTASELSRAEALVREKYGTERWTRTGGAMTARTVAVPGGADREGGR
jgi:lipoate-protein ligase A